MFRCAVAMLAVLVATPVAAEVVETRADGFVVRDAVSVAANPRQTWLALTKPGEWWSDEHTWSGDASNMTLTPQAGGCFCERIPGQDGKDGFSLDGSVSHAMVIQAYPLKVLRLRGGLGPLQSEPADGVLTMTLKEIEGGTRVLWEYNVGGSMRYKPAELAKAVDGVLSQQLVRLRDHLGGIDDPEVPVENANATDEELSLETQIDALERE
ncbi:SRPBCC family protein [Erythrobacter mangrovi]|uniref:SRPBCC family protein n=1 Tax=Erythrobacter mangrovi TaxID=2739433 RepID=A0A7D3XCN3_9SPHN|nr:SRPBCC family protein [Erythrobacter mangrovi]QKG71920.1 SRPBCC family protein [Erythrobacter mangrovi]